MNNELTQAIENLITEKTFSLEAADAIKALKDKAAQLEQSLQREMERNRETFALLTTSQESGAELAVQLKAAKEEIKLLKDHLHAAEKEKLEGKEAKAELRGFTNAMQMVFKPSVVRESYQKRVPVPVEGSASCMGYVTEGHESGTIERSAE